MKNILVIGSLNMDLVVKVKYLPKLGETILGDALYENPGGKGANQAVAAARLGGNVKMIGKIGNDNYGNQLLENLKINHIGTEGIIRSSEATGTAIIEVDEEGHNHIVVIAGSNMKLAKEDIDTKINLIEESDIIILQQEIPIETVLYSLELSKKNNKITILNPAPALKITEEMLKLVDYLILNETELELAADRGKISEADYGEVIKDFKMKGSKNIVLTLGGKGGIYTETEGIKEYKALTVKAVDSTAAGDSFIGAFALRIAEGDSISDALSFAVSVSALTVTRMGAQKSLPTREELEIFLKSI